MKVGSRRFADTIVIDHRAGTITVDGIELPWWVECDPEIVNIDGVINTLRIGIQCEGVAISITEDGQRQIFDPVLGNVGDWATDRVLQGLRERISWLTA
jgi:hypothetical protein